MKLFTDDHAEMCKEDSGKPYRPANGMEGDWFFGEECLGCIHQTDYDVDHFCETESLSFWFQENSERYPAELQYGDDGQPCCRRKTLLPPIHLQKFGD